MGELDTNKIFAAILIALILSTVSGLVAQYVVHPQTLEHQAFEIAVSDTPNTGSPSTEDPHALEDVEPLLSRADLQKGEAIFKKCVQCHTADQGGVHKIGPNLWSIVGRTMAQATGYMYSTALMQKSSEVWSYANLNAFLAQPQHFIRGTKMSFAGLRKVQDRADLIGYLRTMAPQPFPLP